MWQVDFAPGGEAALELLAAQPAEVVIADMQMPGMDGATLLTHVRELYPATIRTVLSRHGIPQVLAQAATVAHRFLGKPYEVTELALLIERSLALRELTQQAEAYRVTAAVPALPTRPGIYAELVQTLSNPSWSPDQIAGAIERDTAMTAKVLQLGNSAFFGVSHHITRVRDAVVYVGVETGADRRRSWSLGGALPADASPAASPPRGRGAGERRDTWGDRRRPAVAVGLPDGVVEAVAHHHDPDSVPGVTLDAVAAVTSRTRLRTIPSSTRPCWSVLAWARSGITGVRLRTAWAGRDAQPGATAAG